MLDWSAGYVSDIAYTYGYYAELDPGRARLPLLSSGVAPPQFSTACELGFGQGLSANLHAAASGVEWYGTDFNPSQTAFAQALANASGAAARLYDDAFADFARRTDLPDFDFIGLHGIWSWISDDNRRVIADFVKRKLKVGGVLYISYNTLPGWAAFAPMRHLMRQHADLVGVEAHGIVSRINGALEFSERLLATHPTYARANPYIAERLKRIKDQDRHYLAHEYFNRDWHPMHFGTLAEWLEPTKVSYACSAHYLDHIDTISLTAEQLAFLREVPDPMFRESVRDFMVNQQFRRDYWIKGPRRLSALQVGEALRAQRVLLTAHRSDIPLKIAGSVGEANLAEAVYAPILDQLADHRPKSLAQIEQAVKRYGVSFGQLLQATMVLVGAGHACPVQEDQVVANAKRQTNRLNAHLLDYARGCSDVSYLASPVTGGGVAVNRFNQLFIRAIAAGGKAPGEWAQSAWHVLAAQGQKLVKDGKALDTAEENVAELTAQAGTFAEKQLPILKALQVV